MPRWVRIVCGYLAASLTVSVLLQARDMLFPQYPLGPGQRLFWIVIISCIVAVLAIPSVMAIVLAEDKAERRFLYYAFAGAIVGAFPIFFMGVISLGKFYPNNLYYVSVFSLLGFVAGSVYWLIAGRSAGRRTAPTTD